MDRDPFIQADNDGRSAQVIQVESSKLMPIMLLLCFLSAGALVAAILMWAQGRETEREVRLLEYYVMELDGKAMANGLIKPPESWSATKEKRK